MRLALALTILSSIIAAAQPIGSGNYPSAISPGVLQNGIVLEYRFDEGSGQIAHNRASPLPTSYTNLIGTYGLGLGSGSAGSWTPASSTPNYTTNPFTGFTNAWRVNNAGGLANVINTPASSGFPAGTYTLSEYLASNTGATQQFRFYNSSGGFSTNFALPASVWANYAWTFTLGSPVSSFNLSGSIVGSGAAPIDMVGYGLKLEAGSSATPYLFPNGDLTLGAAAWSETADPTWTTNGIQAPSGTAKVLGVTSFVAPLVFTNCSAYCVYKTGYADYTSANFAGILTDKWTGGSGVKLYQQHGTGTYFGFGVTNVYCDLDVGRVNDGNWHCYAFTYDGVREIVYMDGCVVGTLAVTCGTMTHAGFFLGDWQNGFKSTNYDLGYFSYYTNAHSQAQVVSNYRAIKTLMARRSIAISDRRTILAFAGDSIVKGQNAIPNAINSYASLISSNLNLVPVSVTVGGGTLSNIIANSTLINASFNRGATNVLFIGDGFNDLGVLGTNTFLSTYTNLTQQFRNYGWKVVASTILPGIGLNNTLRGTANSVIRANYAQWADGLSDFATNAVMGCDSCNTDTTYFGVDAIHPNATGYATLAPIAQAPVQALIP